MPKYYCLLCESSHPEIKPSIKCPGCGRLFCLDSIKQSFLVGITGCPYCDHSLDEDGKSSYFSKFEKLSKTSIKQEKQNIVIYVLIGCITLPFIAIIALLFLRVFLMFFEIFSI